jgi:2'-5' RNA ligase
MNEPAPGLPRDEGATERLFVALTLPPAVRSALAALPAPMTGVHWTRPEQFHVTLRFLGDVTAEQRQRIVERLGRVQVTSFVLPVEGLGTFPPPGRPPRVIWVGTGSGHPRLFQLRQRLDDALLSAGLDLDVRTFHPHITLARCTENAGPAVAEWCHAQRDFTAPPFRVGSFDLYASELLPTGAVHSLRASFPLQ